MDDVHSAHGTASVVEDPILVGVDIAGDLGVGGQLTDNVLDDGASVVAVKRDALRGHLPQLVEVEDVEALQLLVERVEDRGQHAEHNNEVLEQDREAGAAVAAAALAALAAAATSLGGGRGGFGRHWERWGMGRREERLERTWVGSEGMKAGGSERGDKGEKWR